RSLHNAMHEFDRALGMLLESKLDVETDEQLSAEFDKLVDDIHGVELAAIERGDTLSEHKYEAPPIESFAGLTFPVDPKVKQQVQQEIKSVRSDLPLISNDLVDGFITLFQKHARHFMQTVLERRPIYEQMISEELRKEGLPQDLIYLAAREGAFNPFTLQPENYVPIFIATALIAKDPKAYGFEVPANQPLATEQTTVAAPTDLRLVAQLIDRPVEDLIRLNPSLQRWTTPANDRSFVLNL